MFERFFGSKRVVELSPADREKIKKEVYNSDKPTMAIEEGKEVVDILPTPSQGSVEKEKISSPVSMSNKVNTAFREQNGSPRPWKEQRDEQFKPKGLDDVSEAA